MPAPVPVTPSWSARAVARAGLVALLVAAPAGCSLLSSEGAGSPSTRVTTPRVVPGSSSASVSMGQRVDVCAWLTVGRAAELLGAAGKGLGSLTPGAPTASPSTTTAARPATTASGRPATTTARPTTGATALSSAPPPTPTVTGTPAGSLSGSPDTEPSCTYSGTAPERRLVISRSVQVDAAMANAFLTLSFKGPTQSVSGVGDRAERDSAHSVGGWVEQRLMVREGATVTTVRFASRVSVAAYGDHTKELVAVYRALPKPAAG